MPHFLDQPHHLRGRLITAALVCALAVALALLGGQESSAQSQAELDSVRDKQDQIRNALADQNAAIDAALAEAGELRAREKEASAELAEKEAELAAARELLASQREQLAQARREFSAAQDELAAVLVSIYKNGQIDEFQLLLEADGMEDLAMRSEMLGRVKDYQAGVVGRVRDLRVKKAEAVDATEDTVVTIDAARDEIAERQAHLAEASAAAEQREAEMRALRDERRETLDDLLGKERRLIDVLSESAPESSPDTPSVTPPSGSRATLNPDGTANAPANAPPAVKSAIEAGNRITNTPYMWGGGHGSFESSGYDCSGSVSYVLHGGGFLDSPLDSTGLMTWGDSGPGSWITVYANSGHTFMTVAGLRFDTSGAPPRWQTAPRSSAGYVVRHPAGY